MTKKITTIFKKDLERLAVETKFKQKASKLTPEAFFTSTMVSYLINPTASLEDICSLLYREHNIDISKQGLSKRFNRPCVKFMSVLLKHLLNIFTYKKLNLPRLCDQFSKVTLLDSSVIHLPETMKKSYPGFGGNGSSSGLKLQVLFDWAHTKISHVDIKAATDNDQSYKAHLSHLEKSELLIQDLGYFVISSFKQIEEKGAYFLSRYRNDTLLLSPKTSEKLDFVAYLKSNEGKGPLSLNILLGLKAHYPARLVFREVPESVYKVRLRKARKVAKNKGKHPPKARTKYLYRWDIYVTNISREMISDNDIFTLYKVRWQIELLFKLLKSSSGIDKVAGKKEARIICEIYIKLIVTALVLYLTKAEGLEEVGEISLTKAYNKFKSLGSSLVKSLSSTYRLKKLLCSLITNFMKHAVKERGRKPTTLELLGGISA